MPEPVTRGGTHGAEPGLDELSTPSTRRGDEAAKQAERQPPSTLVATRGQRILCGRRGDAPTQARSIALYTPSFNPSGMGGHMLDLAAEYVKNFDVSVMCWSTEAGSGLLERAEALGAVPIPLPPPRDPRFAQSIIASLRDRPADVFHIHVGHGRENFDGARAARRAGVPVVIQTQHLPWLLSGPRKRNRLFAALEPVDHVIMVSQAQRRTYERIGLANDALTTIPNGIRPRSRGLARLAARAALGLHADALVVLTIGRLAVMKGHRYLIDAVPELASRFENLELAILGTGHLHKSLSERAQTLGVGDRVHLPGHRDDARLLLDAADVFALPSRHEGMPLVLLEAMNAGLPVVATRVIGSGEVVDDGVTGFLVEPEDPAALAEALARLLADPDLRQRFGAAGRRRFREHFTSRHMATATADVYRQQLHARAEMRA